MLAVNVNQFMQDMAGDVQMELLQSTKHQENPRTRHTTKHAVCLSSVLPHSLAVSIPLMCSSAHGLPAAAGLSAQHNNWKVRFC